MTKIKKCLVDGCKGKYHARGLCGLHYMRQWHTGKIFAEKPPFKKRDIIGQRFERLTVIKESYSDNHGQSFWECLCDCGNTRVVRGSSLWRGKTKSCGCFNVDQKKSLIGEKSSQWKGGRRELNGYILLKKHGHPNSDKANYIAEHRFVMSEYLKRPLEDWELVHHKNGNRSDNRIENLELLTYTNHRGEITCPHCLKTFLLQ